MDNGDEDAGNNSDSDDGLAGDCIVANYRVEIVQLAIMLMAMLTRRRRRLVGGTAN